MKALGWFTLCLSFSVCAQTVELSPWDCPRVVIEDEHFKNQRHADLVMATRGNPRLRELPRAERAIEWIRLYNEAITEFPDEPINADLTTRIARLYSGGARGLDGEWLVKDWGVAAWQRVLEFSKPSQIEWLNAQFQIGFFCERGGRFEEALAA